MGSSWYDFDPALKITHEGDNYYYEPLSLYVEHDDPTYEEDKYRGVRYCKLLTYQTILSWMLEKSFEDDPVIITPTIPECDQPSSLETEVGSCIFYFVHSETYYCSDYTGSGFTTVQQAEDKCNSRDMAGTRLSPIWQPSPVTRATQASVLYTARWMMSLSGTFTPRTPRIVAAILNYFIRKTLSK